MPPIVTGVSLNSWFQVKFVTVAILQGPCIQRKQDFILHLYSILKTILHLFVPLLKPLSGE